MSMFLEAVLVAAVILSLPFLFIWFLFYSPPVKCKQCGKKSKIEEMSFNTQTTTHWDIGEYNLEEYKYKVSYRIGKCPDCDNVLSRSKYA